MRQNTLTPAEIRTAGLDALARELGPVGMARFLQQFDLGRGDYTKDRRQWLEEETVTGLAEKIRQTRHT